LYGLALVVLGIVVTALSLRHAKKMDRLWRLPAAALAAAVTIAVLLWGSEHVWANPSCSERPHQVSGRITYWSGASVSWICVNGQPIVTHDSR